MALAPSYPGEDAMSGAAPADEGAAPEKDGYTVCIQCRQDGTFMVSVEGAAEEAAEPQGADGAMGGEPDEASEPGGTECKSVKSALTLALEVIRNNGRMPGQADDDFQSGFGASNG